MKLHGRAPDAGDRGESLAEGTANGTRRTSSPSIARLASIRAAATFGARRRIPSAAAGCPG